MVRSWPVFSNDAIFLCPTNMRKWESIFQREAFSFEFQWTLLHFFLFCFLKGAFGFLLPGSLSDSWELSKDPWAVLGFKRGLKELNMTQPLPSRSLGFEKMWIKRAYSICDREYKLWKVWTGASGVLGSWSKDETTPVWGSLERTLWRKRHLSWALKDGVSQTLSKYSLNGCVLPYVF